MTPHRRERGIAIVSALWGSAIVAVIVLSVMQLVRADAGIGRSRLDVAMLNSVADGAINIAILRLLGPEAAQPPVDATPLAIAFAGYDVRLRIRDEAGKIDVNLADAPTLRRALVSVGTETNAAQIVAEAIVAWRSPSPANGGVSRGRNAPFQSVEELQLVGGMSADLYRRIAPLLTVYSHTPWIDPAYSTLAVLNVFRREDAGADAAYRRMEEERLGARPRSRGPGVVLGHAFTITAEVQGAASARALRTAVIRLTGLRQAPLLVYRWG